VRATLPTAALTASRIPDPDAPSQQIIRFATSFDGYAHASHDELAALRGRYESGEGPSLSLHELRLVLFVTQRAHYHQGGAWPGVPDTLLLRMREIVRTLRQRVAPEPSLAVWQGDITRLDVDAIVNAANPTLAGGGGVDGAIHRAAGPDLKAACLALPEVEPGVRCPTGEARITPGFPLPAKHVIHTVGPVWHGGRQDERALLASAYRSSLSLATEHGLDTLAFPAISTGVYGFPKAEAARIAVDTVRAWQAAMHAPARVLLVAFGDEDAEGLRAALAA